MQIVHMYLSFWLIIIIYHLDFVTNFIIFSIHPDNYKQEQQQGGYPHHLQSKLGHPQDYKQPLRSLPLESNTNSSNSSQPYPDHGGSVVNIKTEQPDYSKQYSYNSR